ncbi:calcium-independent phospholipase A2-like protein [Dinothrombium tinctorium]|uniref:Calcium-independent phospholipase A2-like protein n=1 Tax=Dinothrombium tinctorium TaxID=1965070 RepID=A0A443QHN2_9ACAR|nr:calcium-independent phospholipase A2-like protein [Dinothrombium tinctorium]
MVTATVADIFPPDIHIFRNYDPPDDVLASAKQESINKNAKSFPKPSEQLVWMAARSSGAAPTYFRPCGKFVDGGLISNNPTLDALTEIVKYNAVLENIGESDKKYKLVTVVSLGTGSMPVTQVPIIDIFRPDSIMGVAKMAFMASSLGQLLVEQATQADGQVVERAKAWCHSLNVPYFRVNPPLSENIPMDETNNTKLINMLWETTAYMHNRKEELKKLTLLLV